MSYPMDAYFLAQLFPHPLFIADPESSVVTDMRSGKTVVLIQAIEQIPPLQKLLHDILQSCKLDPSQDAIVLAQDSGITPSWKRIQQEWNPAVVLSFGVIFADIPQADLPLYHPIIFDQTPLLHADTLALLHEDKSRKKLLWQALKHIFFQNNP
ncbi:hypothetical protein [Thermoflavifilum thermophilum]|uniref:DNA polymerase III subunit psi n=1 Tax=Thermoflavifilum thermophilum TaxID=1393122 RepID=A0A1I7N3H6_9BACT|nr:hypothetical protein [Thermoflavifilum thermophilum]SFV29214.1 hypothetical protein SAMN05660895_0503 [Thermoflavifilum thermophilum]